MPFGESFINSVAFPPRFPTIEISFSEGMSFYAFLPCALCITRLNIRNNAIGPVGANAITTSMGQLTTLNIGRNELARIDEDRLTQDFPNIAIAY